MRRRTWIVALVAAGGLAAIALGIFVFRGRTAQAETDQDLCSSVSSLQRSIVTFTNLNPVSASRADFEAAVARIRRDWERVQSDANDAGVVKSQAVDETWADFTRDWKDFEQAANGVPWGAPVHDVLFSPWDSSEFFVLKLTSTYGPDCSHTLTLAQLHKALP